MFAAASPKLDRINFYAVFHGFSKTYDVIRFYYLLHCYDIPFCALRSRSFCAVFIRILADKYGFNCIFS